MNPIRKPVSYNVFMFPICPADLAQCIKLNIIQFFSIIRLSRRVALLYFLQDEIKSTHAIVSR